MKKSIVKTIFRWGYSGHCSMPNEAIALRTLHHVGVSLLSSMFPGGSLGNFRENRGIK